VTETNPAQFDSAIDSAPDLDPGSGPSSEPGSEAGQPAPGEWLTVPDVADLLSIPVTRVHQLVRDHKLISVRRDGVVRVPADLLDRRADPVVVVKHLSGVLMLLLDARYDEEESLRWLFTPDDSLPGTPIQALRDNRATEVKRRAQALGF
jgi:hypothetical protein